jgi:hypothetical protein
MSDVDEAQERAQQFHQQLNMMRSWATAKSSELRTVADLLEDDDVSGIDGDADDLREAAARIETVARRIADGDGNIVQQP